MSLSRRSLLKAAATAPLAGTDLVDCSVRIHLGGEIFVFESGAAEDLGAFVSPAGFTQRCLRCTHPRLPLTIQFRLDSNSDRVEVVCELGRLWEGPPQNMAEYRAEILQRERRLAIVNVPRHFWFSRWRWQSSARPIVGNVRDLANRGLLPPYSSQSGNIFAREVAAPRAETYRIMELSGITADMGATGERPDIGLVTENQARYICRNEETARNAFMAQAEAAGSLPWHMRDERTAAPADLDRYATMSWYYDPKVGQPHVALTKTGMDIDSAHQPSLSYLPYLLTGDPYHLEELQFAANFNRGVLPPRYRPSIPQPRAFAWTVRTLSQAARITPDSVPRWLLPAEYFRKDLERTRVWFEANYVNSPDPLRRVFRATDNLSYSRDESPRAPGGTWVTPWQHDFIATALGWIVSMGFEEWRSAHAWQIGGTLSRTTGRDGWHRAYPSPYRLLIKNENNGPVFGTWSDAWRATRQRFDLKDNDELVDPDTTYAIYARGALALAARIGVKDAESPLVWLTEELRRMKAGVPYRWRLT